MEKQKNISVEGNLKQSSLTFQQPLNLIKETQNESIKSLEDESRAFRNEYDFMDGVLGCVKV